MPSTKFESVFCNISTMFKLLSRKLRCFCLKLRWSIRRSKPKIVIKRFGRTNRKTRPREEFSSQDSLAPLNGQLDVSKSDRAIRVATFNAAMFSMAPAVPKAININNNKFSGFENGEQDCFKATQSMELGAKSLNDRPRSILKQSPLHTNSMIDSENLTRQQKFAKSKLRVSINLPDNEISLERSRQLGFVEDDSGSSSNTSTSKDGRGKAHMRSSSLTIRSNNCISRDSESFRSSRTILEVLREVDADILALQDVKAEEEKGMKPLSDLASALGMKYVFAESWAPEYGNAILSKWPIKRWQVQKIFDATDFRNVLKATVDVPRAGEFNFQCTHLDHLDESWRMKQINAVIQSNDGPHILAGGLNSLDETDYSAERWTDIVKYYEEIGKPTPKVEVMKFLKGKQYTDAKDFAGECEAVVMIAKGQNVQGTCKYGTRVDYVLASPNSPYKFVPGSYSVLSSKGTSDHHIVKVDIIVDKKAHENVNRRRRPKQKVVKITDPSSAKGIWKVNT